MTVGLLTEKRKLQFQHLCMPVFQPYAIYYTGRVRLVRVILSSKDHFVFQKELGFLAAFVFIHKCKCFPCNMATNSKKCRFVTDFEDAIFGSDLSVR